MSTKIQKPTDDTKKSGPAASKKIPSIMGDKLWNTIFSIFLVGSSYFIIGSILEIKNFIKEIRKHNLAYEWPKLSDLLPSIYLIPLIALCKTIIEKNAKYLVEIFLAKKYKNPKNKEYAKLAEIYRFKLSRHVYKASFYGFITIFGYIVLKPLDYFPKLMLGNGSAYNLFIKGYPNCYFYKRSNLFVLYYNLCFAYFSTDFIYLFIEQKQSDFTNMLLHHVCTLSLILFSYTTSYSNIGSLVLFLHNETDVLLHITRFLIQTDHYIITGVVGVIFTLNFIYMRQIVFGHVIYVLYLYFKDKFIIVNTTMFLFLCVLFIMHFRWSMILLYKAKELLFKKKVIVDIVNYDKVVKNNNEDKNDKKLNKEE